MSARIAVAEKTRNSAPQLLLKDTMRLLERPYRQMQSWQKLLENVRGASLLTYETPSEKIRAERRLQMLPDMQVIEFWQKAFHEAAYLKAETDQTLALIGMLLDGCAAVSDKNESIPNYMEALCFVLEDETGSEDDSGNFSPNPLGFEGFSKYAIASTVRRSWSYSRYRPTIADFLLMARKVRREFWSACDATSDMLDLRRNAEIICNPRSQLSDEFLDEKFGK